MSGFSFESTAGSSQSSIKPKLAGNAIHNVTFKGAESKDFEGKGANEGKIFKVITFTFENEDGVFEHTIYEPTTTSDYGGGNAFMRGESEYNGTKFPTPSTVESIMLLFKHILDVANPTVAKLIDEKKKTLAKPNWDEIRAFVVTLMTDVTKGAIKDAETKIKLLKNKKGEAIFPGYFSGLSREGNLYMKNNFVGDKIAFLPKEMTKIQNEASAKPTDMTGEDNLLVGDTGGSEDGLGDLDLDFEV